MCACAAEVESNTTSGHLSTLKTTTAILGMHEPGLKRAQRRTYICVTDTGRRPRRRPKEAILKDSLVPYMWLDIGGSGSALRVGVCSQLVGSRLVGGGRLVVHVHCPSIPL